MKGTNRRKTKSKERGRNKKMPRDYKREWMSKLIPTSLVCQ